MTLLAMNGLESAMVLLFVLNLSLLLLIELVHEAPPIGNGANA
ncbi:hypothetical protein [Flaviaesturariibacter terrae]